MRRRGECLLFMGRYYCNIGAGGSCYSLSRRHSKIDVCIVLLFVILYYHFRVSDVSKGLSVYSTCDVNFIFYVWRFILDDTL